jgi:putative addiction module component (TIGR02574 family)
MEEKPKIPATDSIEELARFWDTRDATDYEDEFEEVMEPVFERKPRSKSMAKALKEIEEEALHLAPEDRAELAKTLLLSLEEPGEEDLEKVWAEEAMRRYEEIERGEVEALDFDAVMKELRERRQ